MKLPRWAENAIATEEERDRRESKITIRNNPASDRRILEIGRIARELANPSGLSSAEKIRICANTPDNDADDPMLKALDAIERALAELTSAAAARAWSLANRPSPPKIRGAGRRTLIGPSIRTRPPAKPPAATAAPAAAGSKGYDDNHHAFVGPSARHHLDDGRTVDLSWWNFRDRLAGDLRSGHVSPDPAAIIDHAADHYGLNRGDASELTERFLDSVHRDLERRGA